MRFPAGRSRAAAPASLAALATVLALYSALHSGGGVWRSLDSSHGTYASYSAAQRQHAPLVGAGLPADVYDFYAANLRRGDRVYFDAPASSFSSLFDVRQIVSTAGRFYLLPAVEASDLRDATVVVSYRRDPARLHLRFESQARDGLRPIYVSRLRTP